MFSSHSLNLYSILKLIFYKSDKRKTLRNVHNNTAQVRQIFAWDFIVADDVKVKMKNEEAVQRWSHWGRGGEGAHSPREERVTGAPSWPNLGTAKARPQRVWQKWAIIIIIIIILTFIINVIPPHTASLSLTSIILSSIHHCSYTYWHRITTDCLPEPQILISSDAFKSLLKTSLSKTLFMCWLFSWFNALFYFCVILCPDRTLVLSCSNPDSTT